MIADRRTVIAGAGAALALSAFPAALTAAPADGNAQGKALLDAIAEDMLTLSPERATSLGIDKGARAALRSQTADSSPRGRARYQAMVRRRLAQLRALDRTALAPDVRNDVDIVSTAFETGLDGYRFGFGDVSVGGWRNGPYVVAQNMGAYLDTPKFLDSSHKVTTAADAEAYLARLDGWGRTLDHETDQLVAARRMGVVAPAIIVDKTLAGLRKTLGGDVAAWPVVASLASATAALPGDFAGRAAVIARRRVAPALTRQIAEMTRHRAVATDDSGIWKLKRGDEYYAWALRAATTTRLTPDQVHAQGREELSALHAQMEPILVGLGYTKGAIGARMKALAVDPRFAFSAGDTGRAEIMAEIQRRLTDIRTRVPRAFIKRARGNVEVIRISPAEEMGAPGAYGGPGSLDGSIPGRFYINLSSPANHTRYDLPTLTYHESIPGHVWQGEYNQQLSLVRAMIGFSAFGEGWGLYAEQLADELGVYEGDPVGRLGYLQSMIFRACRLVVDAGLHAKKWTRQQGIDFFAENHGGEMSSEVDRYCVWPGQACGYKIGHSEINRLRAIAQRDMGPRYDFAAFNELVVGGGAMPLTMLEARVRAYIAGARA